jgi:hypothetical protein
LKGCSVGDWRKSAASDGAFALMVDPKIIRAGRIRVGVAARGMSQIIGDDPGDPDPLLSLKE